MEQEPWFQQKESSADLCRLGMRWGAKRGAGNDPGDQRNARECVFDAFSAGVERLIGIELHINPKKLYRIFNK